ncbi:hypothetical protein BJY04DRAFT_176219 [Aspergillus karnatakaensis]|uniref:uncharacterized protein n=1 Tax=Aspergillus karnatakaensis TaxID=1810916 RepID=UPI003CCD596B
MSQRLQYISIPARTAHRQHHSNSSVGAPLPIEIEPMESPPPNIDTRWRCQRLSGRAIPDPVCHWRPGIVAVAVTVFLFPTPHSLRPVMAPNPGQSFTPPSRIAGPCTECI